MSEENGIYAPLTWNQDDPPAQQPEPEVAEADNGIFIVEAVSMFRMRYAVRCRSAEHAADTVVMQEVQNELSQLHLDEIITSTRQVTEAEYLQMFDQDNDYLRSWEPEQKLKYIHVVDYKDN